MRLRNPGFDEKSDKYGCDGREAFDLMFGELLHYLMTLERGPNNCRSLIHSGRTQFAPPHNTDPMQVFNNWTQLVGLKGAFFL